MRRRQWHSEAVERPCSFAISPFSTAALYLKRPSDDITNCQLLFCDESAHKRDVSGRAILLASEWDCTISTVGDTSRTGDDA
jgi:hypothetical protein